GGKGVATFLGVLAGLFWPGALIFAGIWVTTAFLTRYSSLSALLATLATPIILRVFGQNQTSELFFLLVVLIYWAHRENISRLIKGTESRIGQKN
ncbi:MAG: glycerol-3-phosphate acyltransferase, partial [Fimbriimonadaceae bacterium]|nr:glycerol-3-phosphate acyltransferase [Alphaproteobacteria bacterium]